MAVMHLINVGYVYRAINGETAASRQDDVEDTVRLVLLE